MGEDQPALAGHSVLTAGDVISRVTFTAVYEQVENGWTQARVRELPGVITAAPSLEEAKELLVDALREYFLSLDKEQPLTDADGEQGELEIVIRAA